jgi:hypothetical protein
MGVLPQVTEDLTIIKIIKFVGICFICHKNIMSQNSYYMYYKTLPEHKCDVNVQKQFGTPLDQFQKPLGTPQTMVM